MPQWLDAPLTQFFDVKGFIGMISKVKMQIKNKIKRLRIQDFNICPNILHVYTDAEVDADARSIAVALLVQTR